MSFVISDLVPVLPEVFVLTMACVILIADLLIRQSGRLVTYLLVQLTLLGCSLIIVGTHENGVVAKLSRRRHLGNTRCRIDT